MAIPKSVVTGFNHNIKHKGKIYHIQTEDSGIDAAHIITHLFVGGNILASKKTSYADIKQAENLREVVRELMEEQHKEMLRNLINGVYDEIEAAHAGASLSYRPGQIDVGEGREVQLNAGTPNSSPVSEAVLQPMAVPVPVAVPAAVAVPVPVPPQAAPVKLVAPVSPPAPKPKQLPPEVIAARELPKPPPLLDTGTDTIFGEDLISEKSLDEVILSYLAGDSDAKS